MTTDLHAHYVPPTVADFLRGRRSIPRIETQGDGSETLLIPGGSLQFDDAYTDLDKRLTFMDRIGVRRQLLSLPGLFGVDSLPKQECEQALRHFNDAVAAACRRHPARFLGLAALPFADMGASIAEYRRCREKLGLVGAILPNNAFMTLDHARSMTSLFQEADRLGAHFFIHPGRRPDEATREAEATGARPTDNAMARRALDVQADVGQAMVTLLFTDFLDAYPNVSMHVANLGGTLPAVIERMDHTVKARGLDMRLPSQCARRVYVDCSSLGPRMLELAVAVYGADRIVLGTDCPIFRSDWTLAAIREARLCEAERDAILHGNADDLLCRLQQNRPDMASKARKATNSCAS